MSMQYRLMVAALALIVPAGAGAQGPVIDEQAAPPPAAGVVEASPGEYVIGPEDVLDVSVWRNTELSRTVPVRPDGMISLPLLNDVPASGYTAMQLRAILADRYSAYLPAPEISVIVREVHSRKVSVLGDVNDPGRYEFQTMPTVLEAIATAGGLTQFADRGGIVVFRRIGDETRRYVFRYDEVVDRPEANFVLQPGDIIVVP